MIALQAIIGCRKRLVLPGHPPGVGVGVGAFGVIAG